MFKRIFSIFVLLALLTPCTGIVSADMTLSYPEFQTVFRTDGFDDGIFYSDQDLVYKYKASESGGSINESSGKVNLIRNGSNGRLQLNIRANGDYPFDTTALLEFELSKTNAADGYVTIYPDDFFTLRWNGSKISVAYRTSNNETGPNAAFHELDGDYYDTVSVAALFNISTSRFSLWLNGNLVLLNVLSRAVNSDGRHSVPAKVEEIRMYSTSGSSGYTFSMDNYCTGLPVYSYDGAYEDVVYSDINYILTHRSEFSPDSLNSITSSLNFNIGSHYGSVISFSSGDTSVITNDGRVIRPREGDGDKQVTLNVTASYGGVTRTLERTVTVKADEAFTDPGYMTDADFFGVYQNGAWTKTGKLNYSEDGMNAVESAVKNGNYTLAKEKLLEFVRNKENILPLSEGHRYPFHADTYMDMIEGAPDRDFLMGTMYVNSTEGTYSADISSSHFKDGRISVKLISWYNEATELEIYSREADVSKAAYLEIVVNGVKRQYKATKDTYLRTGSYKSQNYGSSQRLYAKMYGDFLGDETKQILLHFDLSDIAITDTLSDAKLVVYGKSNSTGEKKILISYEPDISWDEANVTFNSIIGMFYNFNGNGYSWNRIEGDDIEFMYQMCRFYTLIHSTAEYVATQDEKYAYGSIKMVEDFILKKGNSAGQAEGSPRGQYPRSLDTAERMERFAQCIPHLAKSAYMTADGITAMYKHLWDCFNATAYYYSDDGGNWQQNELLRIARYANYYPEFTDNKTWLRIALDNLSQFIFVHNFEDGAYAEATGGYPVNALNQDIEFKRLAYNAGITISDAFDERLLKAAYYNRLMFTPDGRNPGWGDSAVSKTESTSVLWPEIYEMYGDEEFEYITTYGDSGKEPSWTSKMFPQGRVAFMRSSWDRDAMYLFTNVRGGGDHSNGDDNHIFFSAYSRPLLVDTGICTYTGGTPEKNYAVETIGHNTVEINGVSQKNIHTTGNFTEEPGSINEWVSNSTFDFINSTAVTNVSADHDRTIMFVKPYYFIVSDYITPDNQSSTNTYKQLWHMLPEGNLSVDRNKNIIKSNFESGANVLVASADTDVTTETGLGYFDYGYNNIYNIIHGYFYKSHTGNTTFDTVIAPSRNDTSATLDTQRIAMNVPTTTATAIQFTSSADGNTNTGYYYLSYEASPSVRSFGEFETDGEMAFVNEDLKSKISIVALKNGSYIKRNGEYIVKLQNRAADLAVSLDGDIIKVESTESVSGIELTNQFNAPIISVNGNKKSAVTVNGYLTEGNDITEYSLENSFMSELPSTSEIMGRRREFTSSTNTADNCYYYQQSDTSGGVVQITGGELRMIRNYPDASLSWSDYANGTYGIGNGYITLKLRKGSTTGAEIRNIGAGKGDFFALRWDKDGKLYAQYRDSLSQGSSDKWKYLCDISGNTAEITIFVYESLQLYHIAVNGSLVKAGLYSANAASDFIEQIKIDCMPGSKGDYVYVDYLRCGAITKTPFIPFSTKCNVYDDGTKKLLRFSSDYIGITDEAENGQMLYAAYSGNEGDSLLTCNISDLYCGIIKTSGGISVGSMTGDIELSHNYSSDVAVRLFFWNNSDNINPLCRPVVFSTPILGYPIPEMTVTYRTDNFDDNNLFGGDFLVSATEGTENADFAETGGKASFTRKNSEGYVGLDAWLNDGNNMTDGIVSFTLSKSRIEQEAFVDLLPSDYVFLRWNSDGSFSALYRETSDQDSTTAYWHKVTAPSDDFSADVVVAFNGSESKYSMWINGIPVVINKYSRAVYSGQHSVPTFIYKVRLYSETGMVGDTLAISKYRFGAGEGYGT